MRGFLRSFIPSVAVAGIALTPVAAHADNITMSATYYTIGAGDKDENGAVAAGTFNNEVQNTLGPDGLPILNTSTYGCTSNCFTNNPFPQDLTAGGEITWWSPLLNNGGSAGVSDVVETGTGMVTLPYANESFYPSNGTGPNDASGFQAAVFSTVLDVPSAETISFNVGADDVAFVYLDGSIVCDLGGVHKDSPGACTSGTLNAGDHSLELFFADLKQTGSALTFDVTTVGIVGTPPPSAPEPASWMLIGIALAGFGKRWRRRLSTAAGA